MPGQRGVTPIRVVSAEESLGTRLRSKRLQDGLTQAQLAVQFPGATQQLVGKWERGVAPAAEHHATVAAYLGLRDAAEVQELITGGNSLSLPTSRPRVSGGRNRDDPSGQDPRRTALAALVAAYAKRIETGATLSQAELDILADATAGLADRK